MAAETEFVMLMRDKKLALLQTRFDTADGVLTIEEKMGGYCCTGG